jgi:2-phosphosulfolactate phosphatase
VVSAVADHVSQSGFAYRFGWGEADLGAIARHCDVVVVVDVLRFTTAVSAAVEAGATVYPYRWRDETAPAYAAERGAVLAGRRELGEPSLSPTDLLRLEPATRIVLPSPNGSTIAFLAAAAGVPFVLAGSIRNATATARRARALAHGGAIGVIAAGERWEHTDGPLRPSLEDLLGAGAVLAALDPSGAASAPRCSPEAAAARAAFVDAKSELESRLLACASGRELVERGWDDDVRTAAQLDATRVAAQMIDDAFVAV